jgi:cell division protein FtsN
MNKNTGNKSAAPRSSGSPLLTGILVGMVIGVALAAGLAWFLLKSPSPFVPQESLVARRPPSTAKSAAPAEVTHPVAQSAPAAASSVGGGKPRFTFYTELTGKQDAAATPAKPTDKPQAKEAKPEAAKDLYYLQTASFSNADDAEKQKAKLTLMGMEVSVLTVTLPEKGVWHRVRVGPFKSVDEMNRARNSLKQNSIDATPSRAQ